MDFLALAKKRLRSLERLWLCFMTVGSLVLIFAWLNNAANSLPMTNYAVSILFFAAFGLAGVPFLITKALPIWNLWTPWKDRKTVWATECLVFGITFVSLAWTSSCFFGMPLWQAAKIQICLGLAASPLLWFTARHRWKTNLLETPDVKGTPDESALLIRQEYETHLRKNITAYFVAALVATPVQLAALFIGMTVMGKPLIFNLFLTLIIVSFIINLLIPPIGVGFAKRWIRGRKLRPSTNFFIGASVFSIGSVAVPYIFASIGALRTGSVSQLQFGTYEGILAVVVSTFILGYLVGAVCFERFYHTESQSSDFI